MRLSIAVALMLGGCTEYEIYVHDGTDVFYQDPASAVDILMVVDNSCSMQPYQTKLSTNFAEFISFFADANISYQIGVVTTDVTSSGAGSLAGQYVTSEDGAEGEAIFQDIVNVGITGAANEMGLEAARLALTEPLVSTVNAGFLREDASLSIIWVSDEEDHSPLPTYEYVRTFQDVKGARSRDVFFGSSLVVDDTAACPPGVVSTVGDRYIDVAEQTNGVLGDICAESFADIVLDLSLNASRLMDTFYLSKNPDVSSLQVSVDDRAIGCDEGEWYYDMVDDNGTERAAVVFFREHLPQPSSQVAIRYDYGDGDVLDFCSDGSTVDEGDDGSADTGGAR